MEQLPNGFSMEIPRNSFPLSTDSMVLADFVKLGRNADVLDLGSGCGTLGLLLCAADSGCTVTGLEITPQAHNAAEENIRRNGLQTRCKSICADLRNLSGIFPAGSFSVCVSNPPYFSGGPASSRLPAARRDDCCTPDDLFEAARWALRYGGDFFLIHRPEKLALAIRIARRTRRIVTENIVFALGVKALVLLLGLIAVITCKDIIALFR